MLANGLKWLWGYVSSEIQAPRNYILAALSLIFILLSSILDYELRLEYLLHPEETLNNNNVLPWYQHLHTWAAFSRELGFAFFIAMIIIIFVEKRSRDEQQEITRNNIDSVSDNVLKAVLGINMPRGIVRQVIGTILSTPIIRHDVRLTFTLENLPEEFGVMCDRCVLLRVENTYELENVTGNTVDWAIRLVHPMAPFPEPDIQALAKVENVSFEDSPLPLDEVEKGLTSNAGHVKRYEWLRSLNPGTRSRVSTSYTLIKEVSDNELWTSLLSSTSLEVTVDVRVADCLWDLGSRHAGIIKALGPSQQGPYTERKITFRCEQAVLPHQGVIFWWRPVRKVVTPGGISLTRDKEQAADKSYIKLEQ